MQSLQSTLSDSQYSTVTVNNNLNNSNSTVNPIAVLRNLSDVIHEGYEPFYLRKLKQLGYDRFVELANKARAGSDTPGKLFCWMLKNNSLVK